MALVWRLGDAEMKLDAYTVVFLRRPDSPPRMTEEELDALQQEHIAFNARMREAGHALITGPLSGQPDANLRGINIFRTSIEETRRLMEDDPSIRAGRMEVEVFTWLMPEGLLGDRPAAQIDDD